MLRDYGREQVGAARWSPADEMHAEMPPSVVEVFSVAARYPREEMVDGLALAGAEIVVGPPSSRRR
ncbi:MAG: hypothetical protein ACREXY_22610 [Gammaproteobacteria bacterium]